MSRVQARDCGFKLVFQFLVNKDFVLDGFFEENKLEESEKEFSLSLLHAVKEHQEEVDEKLLSSLKNGLKLTDIYALDHALLASAITEIDYLNEDLGLIINEYVKLAKKYSTEKSPSFINGVLATIYKEKMGK